MYPMRRTRFCATLFCFLAISCDGSPWQSAAQQQNSFILKDKSFSIRSSISRRVKAGRPLVINEHYSIGQHRAKLELQGGASNVATNFYYDARSEGSLIFNPELKLCYEENLDELYQRIAENNGPELVELLKVADRTQDVKFIVGPAKLLFLVAQEANKMERIVGPGDKLYTIRNNPIIEYKLDIEIKPDHYVKMLVFYNELTHSPDSKHTELPVQIIIDISDTPTIDFFGYQLLDDLVRSDLTDALELNRDSDVIIDLFAFPPSYNCSSEMKNLEPLTLFEVYSFSTSRFSFRADSEWGLRSLKHFVAYDGMLQMMRIDTSRKILINELPDTTRVLDLGLNRQYTYLSNKTDAIDQSSGDSERRCIVTQIMSPEMFKSRQSLPLSHFLFETHKFVPMGRAMVHGVGARVFESYSNKLPRWLTQPLLYKDKQGEFGERMPDFRIRESSTIQTSEVSEYSVVVYLADEQPLDQADASAGPKLLLLEIYDMKVPAMRDYRRTLVAKIHSFAWELSDAPKGDSVNNLFSIGERCLGNTPANEKYAEVDLHLSEDANEDAQTTPIEWIKNWWLRNAALRTGLTDSLKIQPSMMYNLESSYSESPRRSIGVTFRVAEHPLKFYDTKFVGNAEFSGDTNSLRRASVNSVGDCLWLVVPTEPVTYVLYVEDAKTCIFDDNLKGFKADPKTSKVFSLNPQATGELFRVEPNCDQEVSLANSWLRDAKFHKIENRILVLQNLRANAHAVDSTDVRMRIKKAKLRNFNYMSRISDEERQVRPAPFAYAGFGYVHGGNYTELAFDSLGEPIDSLVRCQTACLANIECKSFSFCALHPKAQCILAEVDLEAPGTRELLTFNKNMRTGSKFTVESQDGLQVELVRNFRCELRNKIYMDLFKPSWPLHSYLHEALQVVAVNSIEQCAEICMGKNLNLIKSDITLSSQLNELLRESSYDQSEYASALEKLRQQHRNSTRKFCDYFMYLDSSLDEQRQKLLMKRTKSVDPADYCIVESDSSAFDKNDDSSNSSDMTTYQFSSYRFDFTYLYERVPDVRLVATELTAAQREAYKVISNGEDASEAQFQLIRSALNEGKNFQLAMVADPNRCAHLCFHRSSALFGLWPACHSYDIIQQPNKLPICILNTGSLRNINLAPDSVEVPKSSDEQVWHYEPIVGLISQESENNFRFDHLEGNFKQTVTKVSPAPWLVLIVVGGLLSGLIFGIYSARWLDGIIFVEGRGSNDGLASSLVMRSMSNFALEKNSGLDKY